MAPEMLLFDKNGLSFSYPETFNIKGEFGGDSPSIVLENPTRILSDPKTTSSMMLIFERVWWDFNNLYNEKCNPSRINFSNSEIIRAGIYSKYSNSVELLYKYKILWPCDLILYYWCILIPLESGTIHISLSITGEEALNSTWVPLINSIEFDFDKIQAIPKGQIPIPKPEIHQLTNDNSVKHTCQAFFHSIGIYDSSASILYEEDVRDIDVQRNIIKRKKQFTLFPGDALEISMDFHLVVEGEFNMISDSWYHVIEGIIDLSSGSFYVDDDSVPAIQIVLPKGNYKFRVSFSKINIYADSRNIRIDLCPTTQKETNDITILRFGEN